MPQVPDVPLEGLYGEVILDHYRNPRNRCPVADADVEAEEFNPFCGDRVTVQLRLDRRGHVTGVSARSEGCSIIQASASMMTEALKDKSLAELEALAAEFRDLMQGRLPPDSASDAVRSLDALQVVRQYPVRVKCALLPWTALEEGIEGFRSRAG